MKIKKLITHNGSFHTDDLFACATLSLYLNKKREKFEIIRTRDKESIENGDIVFDVGGIYDVEKNRFDHHQLGGAGERENKIPYSSFGLIWKHYGMDLCDNNKDIWNIIDLKIACPIDAIDNGVDISISKFENISDYSASQIFLAFSPTWKEEKANIDEIFKEQVLNVMKVLQREIKVAEDEIKAIEIIKKNYNEAKDKRIIELENNFPRYLYQSTLSSFLEPVYVIYKSDHHDDYKVEAIQKSKNTMESRKPFKKEWRGLLDGDNKLKEITGINDIIFCHQNGFLLGVKTKEGARKLAELSLI